MPSETRTGLADELIVVRCQLGERAAFDALMHRWSEPLYRHACRLCGDTDQARDLAQDIWLRVLRGIGGLKDRTRFRSWLFGIAHRAFVDTLRTRYNERDAGEIDLDAIPDEALDGGLLIRELHQHLAHLPPVEREALTLFYLQELTLDEVATVLSIPVGTVKSRLHRARRLLRALMNPLENAT